MFASLRRAWCAAWPRLRRFLSVLLPGRRLAWEPGGSGPAPGDVGARSCRNSATIPRVTLRSAWSLRAGKISAVLRCSWCSGLIVCVRTEWSFGAVAAAEHPAAGLARRDGQITVRAGGDPAWMVAEVEQCAQAGVIEAADEVIASFGEVGPSVVVGRDYTEAPRTAAAAVRMLSMLTGRSRNLPGTRAAPACSTATSTSGMRWAISALVRMEALSPLR